MPVCLLEKNFHEACEICNMYKYITIITACCLQQEDLLNLRESPASKLWPSILSEEHVRFALSIFSYCNKELNNANAL